MKTVDELLCEINKTGGCAETYQLLGKAYVDASEIDKASISFMKSLMFDDQDPWTHLYLGNISYRKKDYHEAIVWFEKSMRLMQDAAVSYWCLAEAYEKLGEIEKAASFFHKAVEVEPESEEAQKRLAAWIETRRDH